MSWRLAKSLEALRSQINDLYPNRSKTSDGTIGDAAHASRDSDHNPWVKITEGGKSVGIVTGMDLTHDPADGMDSYALAETMRLSGDKRLKYIISNGRIASATKNWAWRVYTGKNKHDHHVHVSVQPTKTLFDDTAHWALTPRATPASTTEAQPLLAIGSTGAFVKVMQSLLVKAGIAVAVDGDFGSKTEKAVKAFQRKKKLLADGRVGGKTWAALRS